MSVPPAVLRRLMREISELQRTPPEGIRIQTHEDNMLDVTGVIEGPEGTPYAGGYFSVKFKFTEEFPAAPPKCWMATKIFHPNVSNAGEICVNTLKKDWQASYGIGHILVTVKCLLIHPNPESALDEEAGKLLLEDYNSYCSRAKLMTSVHARVRPAVFDTPAASTSATSTTPSSKPPSTAGTPTTPVLSVPSRTPTSRKSASPAPTAVPQVPFKVSNAGGEDHHPSPSPLGTADSNVGGAAAAAPATKAVKRAATGGASSGAEKRKKALKRL
ncbi:ubiquitin-conjugating enzyme/RWD-like protein [Schizophyllum amplum]|uniref:E2 ubiquitin-conjugating enzyme n=1 Tax=Schizophyllum amplum TaxID=97359 RepID=A0A550BVU2_9AGAR|nr:ubiquitin-conjugating enzyme/RWD-like protein [Auriculariopsis ampla]